MTEFETLDAVLGARFSCRAFQDRAVPKDVITQIVTSAQKVPSWCNSQPWHLTVTSGHSTEKLRTAMMDAAQTAPHAPDIAFPEKYVGVYKERRSTCGWQLYDAVGVKKGDRAGSAAQMMQNFSFFGAPHVAIVTTPAELGAYGVLDCGAFVTAFTLVAQSLGVATVPQAAIAGYAPQVRAALGLEAGRQVLCAISFGYADMTNPANQFRTGRADAEEVISWA